MRARRPTALPMMAGFVMVVVAAGCSPSEDVASPSRRPDARGTEHEEAKVVDGWPRPPRRGPRPNILLIVTDDQRADHTFDVMPRTRDFFGEGTVFRDAFATTPLCCPARASIMTGRYAHNHGIERNFGVTPERLGPTLQEYLQQSGYRTAMVGKLFNAWNPHTPPPGFDRWAMSLGDTGGGFFDTLFNLDGRLATIERYSTDFIEQWAIRMLKDFESDDETPWFLYVAPYAPHRPAVSELAYEGAEIPPFDESPAITEADRSDKPPNIRRQTGSVAEGRAMYESQMRTLFSVDDLVAALVSELERLGEGEDTLAVYTSDNGQMWGEHGTVDKRFPYPGSAGIPLMFRWPGRIPEGAADDRLGANVDIAPTVLDAARVRLPVHMDGRSFFGSWDREWVLTEHWQPTWAAIRTDAYLYVEWYALDRTTVTFREFYDLDDDPWMLENVLGDDDDFNDPPGSELREAERRLARSRFCSGAQCP